MQTYSGKWAPRFGFLLLGLLGFGMFYFVGNGLYRNVGVPSIDMLALFFVSMPWGLFGLLLGCVALYGISDAFSVYHIDDNVIEKRAHGRRNSLSWQSIIDFQYSGSKETTLNLEGEFGERLEIDFDLIHDPRGEFRADVERCLQPLHDRRLKEPRWRERSSYPLRVPAVMILFFGLILCGLGGGVLLDPQIVPDSLAERIGTGLFCLCGSLVPILFGINSFTYRISVRSDAIGTDSLFRHRHLPYARIDEFLSRTATGEGEPTRFTTLIGAAQQIWFSDSIPDYAHIRDYIVSRIDPQAVVRGEAGLPARIARESKRDNVAGALVVSVLIGAMLGIMAWITIAPAQGRLARQISLDAHGITVSGHIAKVHGPCCEDSGYYLDYAFPASGKTQNGYSSVAQSVYAEARPGQPIAITYLPDDPTINCSPYTTRVRASSVYPTWYRLFVLTGFCPPLITAFALFAKARPRRTAIVY